MSDDLRPPLPWETKAAIGALFLLGLQCIHGTWLLCVGRHVPGYGDESSAAPVCLALIAGAGIGLWSRSRTAWWCTVIIPAAIGLLFLLKTWEPMSRLLPWASGTPRNYDEGMRRGEIWGRLFWMGARVALHLAAPFFLILGRLREQLRPA